VKLTLNDVPGVPEAPARLERSLASSTGGGYLSKAGNLSSGPTVLDQVERFIVSF
jgi:hypothetical protein